MSDPVKLIVRTPKGKIGEHILSEEHAYQVGKNWLDRKLIVSFGIETNLTEEEIARAQEEE